MPIYEHQCKACGHRMEVIQKASEGLLTTCPECHKNKLEKLISATSFHLKGTGWYVTDFRDSGKKVEKKDENQSDKKAETTAEPNPPKETAAKKESKVEPTKKQSKEGKS